MVASEVRGEPGSRVGVRIEFVPALPARGELHLRHECGEQLVVPTGHAHVELTLPEGPVALLLVVGGNRYERVLRIVDGMTTVVWRI